MHDHPQGAHIRLRQLWALLVKPSSLEGESAFRASLTEVMYAGLWWGGGAAVLATAIHVVLSIGAWGESPTWVYSTAVEGEVALLYHAFVCAMGGGLMALSATACSLSIGRLVGGGAVLLACGASLHDDLVQGPSIAVEYVFMIYMVGVVMVPFRPWQALGVGGGILGLYAVFVEVGVGIPDHVVEGMSIGDDAPLLIMAIVIGSAVCTVLYATRWAQHRVRRTAETKLTAAKERAEAALDTVEEQAEQLRELDEMKSRFFANISHELRTPLSLMVGPIRQLLDRERPEAEAEELQVVHRNAERLQRLVEQLLDLARYDAGRLDMDLQQTEWDVFVERVAHRLAPMAEAEGVELSVHTDDADRSVMCDPNHMETVIANLLRNALTYTSQGGAVAVDATVQPEAAEACLVVEDTGPGLSAEEQEVLFERYYRGSEQAQLGGTGIGLALTKRLVDLHDGEIEVDSAPGAGSTFTVRLPIAQEPAASASDASVDMADELASLSDGSGDGADVLAAPGAPPLGDEGEGERLLETDGADRTTVLVVEDNADVRQYVCHLLNARYRLLTAPNGREGIERARTFLPDLVVSDVMMPEVDGFDMLRALRQSRRTDCIPVVMLTARAGEADQIEGLEVGAEAYLTKPFDAEVLTAQIDRLISTRQRLRERFAEEAAEGNAADDVSEIESFEERVRAAVRAHLADPDFSVEQLAEAVRCTRRTLTRRVKEEAGQTPSQLIRAMRVERGAELIDEGAGSISEVAYAVGFNSLSYFSRSFKEHFGCSPSTYQAEKT